MPPVESTIRTTRKGKRSNPAQEKFFGQDEVFEQTKITPYVLKFWEAEFPFLKSKKDKEGHQR